MLSLARSSNTVEGGGGLYVCEAPCRCASVGDLDFSHLFDKTQRSDYESTSCLTDPSI